MNSSNENIRNPEPLGNSDPASVQEKYEQALRELSEKEAFNFALFQYNPVATVIVDREGRVVKSNLSRRAAGDRLPLIGDRMYVDYASKHTLDMRAELMRCIEDGQMRKYPVLQYREKFISITIAPFSAGAIITSQDITEQKKAEQDSMTLIAELMRALDEVEQLRGLLPICASCKNIRDDKGYWNTVEQYFSGKTGVDFSHTVCPACMQKLYPEQWEKIKARGGVSS
jgi:hypothetical protein